MAPDGQGPETPPTAGPGNSDQSPSCFYDPETGRIARDHPHPLPEGWRDYAPVDPAIPEDDPFGPSGNLPSRGWRTIGFNQASSDFRSDRNRLVTYLTTRLARRWRDDWFPLIGWALFASLGIAFLAIGFVTPLRVLYLALFPITAYVSTLIGVTRHARSLMHSSMFEQVALSDIPTRDVVVGLLALPMAMQHFWLLCAGLPLLLAIISFPPGTEAAWIVPAVIMYFMTLRVVELAAATAIHGSFTIGDRDALLLNFARKAAWHLLGAFCYLCCGLPLLFVFLAFGPRPRFSSPETPDWFLGNILLHEAAARLVDSISSDRETWWVYSSAGE